MGTHKPDLNPKLFGRPDTLRRHYLTGIVAHRSPEAIHKSAARKFPDSRSVQNQSPRNLYFIMLSKARNMGLLAA